MTTFDETISQLREARARGGQGEVVSEQKYQPIDRTGWQPGSWDDEPEDRIEWRDESTGLSCLMRRTKLGVWCGYVACPPGHPMHGKSGSDCSATGDLRVHGGITYGAACSGEICHVPSPGEPDDVWWLGSDCNHSGDLAPRNTKHSEWFMRPGPGQFYCGEHYVQREVESLARQLKDMVP